MFKEILKNIDFESSDSFLFVNQRDSDKINESCRKILYLAKEEYDVDAVFFQIKESNKFVPQIFIYNNTKRNKFDSLILSEIHKRFWSSQIVPLYFIIEESAIKVYNTKQKISINNEGKEEIKPTDILDLSKKVSIEFQNKKNEFSAYLFQNGSFWESKHYINKYLKEAITKESPFEILIENLHGLKKDLIENGILKEIANKIVIFSILIKYLEEKKDENGFNVFTVKGNIFKEKWDLNNFSELIEAGGFINLLDYLSEKFNGKIFELSSDEKEQIKNLPINILGHLSFFVDANYKTRSKQLYLWRLYSFRYLPVELISRIYEEFIPDTDGVVYTPPFLVDLLIDECMPLEDYYKFSNNKFKVIDPACGSGIFCVSAYQRLIDWHIINNFKNTKEWNKNLGIDTLKEILVENIYGVDKEPGAVNIAVFSLVLALLEKLTPMQLWEDLDFGDKNKNTNKRFKNLKEENIIHDNFFNYLHSADKDFDLVIGNPPFIRQNLNKLKKDFKLNYPEEIPANLSILFLDQSVKLLKKKGLQCLILPTSSILYNEGSMKYRNLFFEKFSVPQIIDFTHLRRHLFNKDVATCAFFAQNQPPNNGSQILHLISHRTTNEENQMFFMFDTYDFHLVPLNVALKQKNIWKSNLIGGGRLNWIANRFSEEKSTIDSFIQKSENIIYLTGNYEINQEELNKKGIILIKRLIKRGIIQIIEVNKERKNNKTKINFKYDIGICFKNKKSNNFGYFLNELLANTEKYSFLIALNSVEYLFERETSYNKIDFKKLPFPQTEEEKQIFQLSEAEQIWQHDVFDFYIHQGKASKNNPLNEIADRPILESYANTFTWLMNLNYNPVKNKSFATKRITKTNSFVAVEFHYCEENIDSQYEEKTEKEYQNYFEAQIGRNKKITKIVEYIDFENNKIFYIKPHQKRYWLKSIADRDAMKCFAEFGNNIFKDE